MARSLRKLGSKLDAQSVLAPLLPYLTAHSWPGNVRELENITDRISVFLLQFNNQNEITYDGLRVECPELFLPENPGADGAADQHLKTRLLRSDERRDGKECVRKCRSRGSPYP